MKSFLTAARCCNYWINNVSLSKQCTKHSTVLRVSQTGDTCFILIVGWNVLRLYLVWFSVETRQRQAAVAVYNVSGPTKSISVGLKSGFDQVIETPWFFFQSHSVAGCEDRWLHIWLHNTSSSKSSLKSSADPVHSSESTACHREETACFSCAGDILEVLIFVLLLAYKTLNKQAP